MAAEKKEMEWRLRWGMLLEEAQGAGMAALEAAKPNAMVVSEANIDGSAKQGGQSWYVSEGVCGFAWVTIRPARGAFVNYLKANGIGRLAYGGGWQIWIREGGQSYERKMAYAEAYAEVLRDAGLKAYAGGRLD